MNMEDEKIIKKFVNGIFIVGVFRHEDSKESFPNILRNIRKTWNHGKDSGYEYSDGGMYYPLFRPLFFSESEEMAEKFIRDREFERMGEEFDFLWEKFLEAGRLCGAEKTPPKKIAFDGENYICPGCGAEIDADEGERERTIDCQGYQTSHAVECPGCFSWIEIFRDSTFDMR